MNVRKSSRLLFTTFDGGGNVAPIMKVVADLVARGHSVRVMSDEVNRDEARAAGADFVSWARAPNKVVRDRDLDPKDWAAATPEQAVLEMSQHFMCGLALAYAQDVTAELDREPADLVIDFDMLLGVMAACEARRQKLALLSTMISLFPVPGIPPFGAGLAPAVTDADRALHAQIAQASLALFDSGLPALNAARAELGLAPLEHVFDQANAASVRWLGTARAFDFTPEVLPEHLRYVGPLIRDPVWAARWQAPWPASDQRPLVVVAFSTSFQNHARCVQNVVDACAGLPVRVLVTLGGSLHRDEIRPAANTVVVASAPHVEAMRGAAVVVTHGGHGTVMTALAAKAPLLVLPHGRDQGDNAARVAARGAGLRLPSSASVDELRSALGRLLDEPAFRASARRLGEAVVAEARGSTLIEEIETLARSNTPGAAAGAGAASDADATACSLSRRAALTGLAAAALVGARVLGPRAVHAAPSHALGETGVAELRKSVAGEVVPWGASEYAAVRESMTWGARKSERMPDAIVRVRTTRDVAAAVRFAAAHGLKVAVRSGGHNYHSASVRDGGLLLDLSALDAIQVDAAKRRASVQPGVKSGALVAALTPSQLAFPVGHCADVGLGGFLLNGGLGWNVGEWGPACLSVRGIEVVTASGDVVYADAAHDADLLWAARGAGPGYFGVVTRYDLDLKPLPREMGMRVTELGLDSLDAAGGWIAELAANAPPQVEIVCVLGANGPVPRPDGRACTLLVASFAFADREDQARRWLAPFGSPPASVKRLGGTDYEKQSLAMLQAGNDESFPDGYRFSGDHAWSNATPRELLTAVRETAAGAPTPRSFQFFSPNTVRVDLRKTADEAAFSMAATQYFGAYAFWDERSQDRANLQWLRASLAAVEPLAIGQYVGEADFSVGPNRVARCFSPEAWARLQALRATHDPAGTFFAYLERN